MKKALKTLAGLTLLAPVIALALGMVWLAYYAFSPLSLATMPMEFSLKAGSSLKSVARQMVQARVLDEPWGFVAIARLLGRAGDIKAGNYELEKTLTPLELLDKITSGDYTMNAITFVEGWTFKDFRKALDENSNVIHESKGMSDAEVLKKIGAVEESPEGLFFPDTFFFTAGTSDLALLRRSNRKMHAELAAAWGGRRSGLPFATPYEALILASIVEKETGEGAERPFVAGVFINRLRQGMKLQTDPTVIYGLGQNYEGKLHKKDLADDNPYNTYTRTGLPPTPIAMPGLAALEAALHPANTNALYFVARGNGTSQFSDSLDEHNRAVNKYQLSSPASR